MSLRAIAFEEMRMRACYDMTEVLRISPLEGVLQPLELFASDCAIGRIIDNKQVLLACWRLHHKIVGTGLEDTQELLPELEINIVVAAYSHECIMLIGALHLRRKRLLYICHIGSGINNIAQVHCHRAQLVGAIAGDKMLPTLAIIRDMRIGADVEVVVLCYCIEGIEPCLLIISHRLLPTLINSRRTACKHTHHIQAFACGEDNTTSHYP